MRPLDDDIRPGFLETPRRFVVGQAFRRSLHLGKNGIRFQQRRLREDRPGEQDGADYFFLTQGTLINSISFTGLIPSGATTGQIVLEIYRVFPLDSGPFDNQVNTRTNSPSDVAFASREWKPLALAWSWILLGFIGSLGLHTPFYRFLFNYVPGFRAVEEPPLTRGPEEDRLHGGVVR